MLWPHTAKLLVMFYSSIFDKRNTSNSLCLKIPLKCSTMKNLNYMYLCYYIGVNMPPKIPVESKKMMLKVYDYFVTEFKRGAPFYSGINSNKRAAHCLNISLDSLRKIIKARDESKSMEFQENKKTFKKDSDQFDKDVIKNVMYGYFSNDKCVTLRKLNVELDENHGIKLTKYKLWKTLHELGFRYINCQDKEKLWLKDLTL